jgi:hypothetical protein
LPDGSAIITWSSYGQDGSMWGVYARNCQQQRRFPYAKEFLVNQYTQYNQRKPAVATLANGQFVVCLDFRAGAFFNSVDVYARIFTAAGKPVTDEIAINSGTKSLRHAGCRALNDGGFTVVWAQKDMEVATNSWDIWGRAFNAVRFARSHRFSHQHLPFWRSIPAQDRGRTVGQHGGLDQHGTGRLARGCFWALFAGGTAVSGTRNANQHHHHQPATSSGGGVERDQQFPGGLGQFYGSKQVGPFVRI